MRTDSRWGGKLLEWRSRTASVIYVVVVVASIGRLSARWSDILFKVAGMPWMRMPQDLSVERAW